MLTRIEISQDLKTATLHFTDRSVFTLYQSEGKVIQMLDEFLAPIETNCTTLTSYMNSFDDTMSIAA